MVRRLLLAALAALVVSVFGTRCGAQSATVRLPAPDLKGRVTLEKVLGGRRSVREYAPGALGLGEVSQLLWAAHGITGPGGKRTTPSARAVYPLEIFLVARRVTGLEAGVYRYLPEDHALLPSSPGGAVAALTEATPRQAAVAAAPVVILVAADSARAAETFGARAERWAAMETGFVVQDVYLEATALGLGTVMVGGFDGPRVHRALGLPAGRELFALLPVGRKK